MKLSVRPIAGIAGVAAAVLLLSACGSSFQPGAAYVVGGRQVGDDVVATSSEEVLAALDGQLPQGATPDALNRQIVSALVQEDVIGEAAARAGVTVTQGQIDTLINDAATKSGGKAALEKSLAGQYAIAPSQLQAFARANLQYQGIAAKLGNGDPQAGSAAASTYIGKLSDELGVKVSPRFGSWQGDKLTVTVLNDLSAPLATAVPTPAATS